MVGMIIGIRTVGIAESDVRRLLAWAVDRNEAYYRATNSRPITMLGLTYLPDPISDRVIIVCADALASGPVSCGTAAAAWCGYQRAHDRYSYVRLRAQAGLWHAYVETPGGSPRMWDPAVELLAESGGSAWKS